jgi:hypothetical protein
VFSKKQAVCAESSIEQGSLHRYRFTAFLRDMTIAQDSDQWYKQVYSGMYRFIEVYRSIIPY